MKLLKVQASSSKCHKEFRFIGGSWLALLMSTCMLAAVFVPYFIVLARGTLTPFLPFISQAAGSPPQSGIFNLLLTASCLLAFIGLNLLNMGISIRAQREKNESLRKMIEFLNRISLCPGHVGILGMLIVAAYPIDFYRNSPEWMGVTLVPHLTGALSLFLGGLFYCILMTYVLYILQPDRKQMLGIRIFLVSLLTMCSALQGYTVREGFMNENEEINILPGCVIQPEHVPYNLSYLVSSVCEWLLVLSFVVFFMTLKEEARDFCFTMRISLTEDEAPEKTEEKAKNKEDVNHNTGSKEETTSIDEETS